MNVAGGINLCEIIFIYCWNQEFEITRKTGKIRYAC